MPQKRDKKLSKRAQKRIERSGTSAGHVTSGLRPLSMSSPMHTWPIHECLVPEGWQSPDELVQVVVTRRSESGEFASAVFLVDLGCLGVKNAFADRFAAESEYESWLAMLPAMTEWQRISVDLAAKIVRTAIEYAASLGFKPHRDFAEAAPFLLDAHPELATEDVPTGRDGKPFFVNGPYDDVRKIKAQLDRAVGPGNYDFVLFSESDDGLPTGTMIPIDERDTLP